MKIKLAVWHFANATPAWVIFRGRCHNVSRSETPRHLLPSGHHRRRRADCFHCTLLWDKVAKQKYHFTDESWMKSWCRHQSYEKSDWGFYRLFCLNFNSKREKYSILICNLLCIVILESLFCSISKKTDRVSHDKLLCFIHQWLSALGSIKSWISPIYYFPIIQHNESINFFHCWIKHPWLLSALVGRFLCNSSKFQLFIWFSLTSSRYTGRLLRESLFIIETALIHLLWCEAWIIQAHLEC